MRLIANLFKTLLILALLLGVGLLGLVLLWQSDLKRVDDLSVLEYAGKATVVDDRGQVIGALTPSLSSGARVNRSLLKSNQMSSWLRKAVVTSEDTRFYQHGGIDPRGLLRAVFRSASGDTQGGSTITQQVVRSTILADIKDEKTLSRKLKEALLAVQVERRFTKDEILTAYLNVVYWGVGRTDLLGAQDAARTYFGVDASRLNLAQSVYLATLLPNARRYNDYPAYRPLIHNILDRMVKDGRATQAQADAAWHYHLQPVGWSVRYDAAGNLVSARLSDPSAKRASSPAPQVRFADGFLDAVERDLSDRLGRSVLYRSDVTVYTTLNHQAQAGAEVASRDARLPDGATLGLALMNPANGDVTALVGQKLGDGVLESWNNATRARRQVGSSIKPLLYTLALSKGFKQSDTILDAPIDGDYQPKNYSGTSTGRRVTLRYALDHSLNLPTVRLAQQVGLNAFVSKLRELGLSPAPDTGLPLAIGALEASPLQMAAAYAPFANGGIYHAPRLITKVVQSGKTILTVAPSEGQRVWDTQTAFLGLDMLRGVVNDLTPAEGGLGWRARINGREVGGKTGTTNDVRDLWFAGVTPGLSGAVWVGRSDNTALPQTAYSGEVAAPVWQEAAAAAVNGQAAVQFSAPQGVTFQQVRGVQMAFKTDSGTSNGGFLSSLFGGRSAPEPVPPSESPAESQAPAVTAPDPVPTEPEVDQSTPDALPTDAVPTDALPSDDATSTPDSGADVTPEPSTAQPDTAQPVPDQSAADQNSGSTDDSQSSDSQPSPQVVPDPATVPDSSPQPVSPRHLDACRHGASGFQFPGFGSVSVHPGRFGVAAGAFRSDAAAGFVRSVQRWYPRHPPTSAPPSLSTPDPAPYNVVPDSSSIPDTSGGSPSN
ncbi:transglycosylase domain-containing protein [Deinococcus sp. KNUC1210]|uniref:transglycosylase domain-containing protein n=1 Tax=Deinococcus sp. KNUC1210 TaxID=2917691 RepID=UPI001EF04773|nr:transglycosylase domain-containing protein [Deinococcus sp. KNUC1210]ULH14500.1 transglycosylase domain-containing protein [Deinococcus sp. KNUC1210]